MFFTEVIYKAPLATGIGSVNSDKTASVVNKNRKFVANFFTFRPKTLYSILLD